MLVQVINTIVDGIAADGYQLGIITILRHCERTVFQICRACVDYSGHVVHGLGFCGANPYIAFLQVTLGKYTSQTTEATGFADDAVARSDGSKFCAFAIIITLGNQEEGLASLDGHLSLLECDVLHTILLQSTGSRIGRYVFDGCNFCSEAERSVVTHLLLKGEGRSIVALNLFNRFDEEQTVVGIVDADASPGDKHSGKLMTLSVHVVIAAQRGILDGAQVECTLSVAHHFYSHGRGSQLHGAAVVLCSRVDEETASAVLQSILAFFYLYEAPLGCIRFAISLVLVEEVNLVTHRHITFRQDHSSVFGAQTRYEILAPERIDFRPP